MHTVAVLKASCNPTGRISRKGFLHLALIILAIQIATYGLTIGLGMQTNSLTLRAFDLATLWICLTAATKRLHDTDRGAVWILYAIAGSLAFSVGIIVAAILLFGQTVLLPQSPYYFWLITLATLPAFIATLWLHFAKGDEGRNRYGPAPGQSGFSAGYPDQKLAALVDQ